METPSTIADYGIGLHETCDPNQGVPWVLAHLSSSAIIRTCPLHPGLLSTRNAFHRLMVAPGEGGRLSIGISRPDRITRGTVATEERSHPSHARFVYRSPSIVNSARASWKMEMIQAVLEEQSPYSREALEEAGFRRLAWLIQMELDIARYQSAVLDSSAPLNWRRYEDQERSKWIAWLDATYAETCDCPELNGMRSTDQALAGYLAMAGGQCNRSAAPQWWSASFADCDSSAREVSKEIDTAFMLSDLGNRVWELSYMGVIPKHRGRGMASVTLDRSIAQAKSLGAERVVLAVDTSQ